MTVTEVDVAKDLLVADVKNFNLGPLPAGIGDIDPPQTRLKKPPDKSVESYFVVEFVRKVKGLNELINFKIERAVTVCRDAGLKLCMWGSVMTV